MHVQINLHVEADSSILAGRPVIAGTQVPVSAVVERVGLGKTLAEVAQELGITLDEVRAALDYAALRAGEPITSGSQPSTNGDEQSTEHQVEEQAAVLGLDPAKLSPLGRRLLAARAEVFASGIPPITSWDALAAEIAEGRGEKAEDDGQ